MLYLRNYYPMLKDSKNKSNKFDIRLKITM